MKVSELVELLKYCSQDARVVFIHEDDSFSDVNFVENSILRSSNGCNAVVVRLYEEQPIWFDSEDSE